MGARAVMRHHEDVLQAPQVGVWDQWCVLSRRAYSKEGDQSLMDETACRQFIENFRRSPDDLPCNISHDKSKVVGWYNAMALFVGGQLVDFASHDPAVPQPTPADLPGGDDGSPPDDGIYWRRARLTDIGMAAAQYLRKVSPEFFMRGKNQFEEEVGPLAVGGAWTNYPFLPGCEKHEFERVTMPKKTYAQRCFEEAGVGKDDDEKTKFSKVTAYWRGKHGGEYAKYEGDAGVGKDDDEPTRMTKMMAYMAGKYGDLVVRHDDDEPGEMTGPSVSGTAPPVVNGGAPSQDQVPGGGGQMSRESFQRFARELGLPEDPTAARAKLQTLQSAAQDLPRLNQQVQQLTAAEQKRREFEKGEEAQKFVHEAWRRGQIKPRQSEKHEEARGRILQLYTKSGKEAAEAALLEPGSFTPPEAMAGDLQLYSFERPQPEAGRPDEEILRRARERMKKDGIENPLDPKLSQYCRAVAEEDPGLSKRYLNQSRAALFEGLR